MAIIFQRGKAGTWWIKYYAGGRQVYHSLRTSNQRAALTIKRQIEGDEARGELVAPSRTPLPKFLEEFCRYQGLHERGRDGIGASGDCWIGGGWPGQERKDRHQRREAGSTVLWAPSHALPLLRAVGPDVNVEGG